MAYKKTILFKMKFLISFLMIFFISIVGSFGQTTMTKIKDGSLTGTPPTASTGVILELESSNKGFLTPRLSTSQRDAIPVVNRRDGLLIFNTTTGCFNYWASVQDTWLSICGTPPPALLSISTVQCSSIVINGNYTQGNSLTNSNFLSVPVTVSQPGTYDMMAITQNGYYFTASGVFAAPGDYTIIMNGMGTPSNGYPAGEPGDVVSFSVNGRDIDCEIHIPVIQAAVSYEISCGMIDVFGDYFIGQETTNDNYITVEVNVATLGYWSIQTNRVNGYSFRGTGTFTQTGVQTIRLAASGTPSAPGVNSFNLSSNSSVNASCTNIEVTVKNVSLSIDCTTPVFNGQYMQDVAMNTTNTVSFTIDVQATGQTSFRTNEVDGVYFATDGEVYFDTIGEQSLYLTAVGTPTSSGIKTFTLQPTLGLIATCGFDLQIDAQPINFNMTCSTIIVNGSYAPDLPMNGNNTIELSVDVKYIGDYTITTNTVNGVSFSGSGTFVQTGIQPVVLLASGTPLEGGDFLFTLTNNSSGANNTCNVNIEFVYQKVNLLGLGGGVYQPASAGNAYTAKALLASVLNFGTGNATVKSQGFNLIDGGGNQGNALKNLINNNKIDIIFIGYNYLPNAASIVILNDFVKNKKGVLIHSQENSNAGVESLINTIDPTSNVVATSVGGTYLNDFVDIDDDILNGPFGDIRNKFGGSDVLNSYYVTGYSNNFTPYAFSHGSKQNAWIIKHNTLGYFYCGDSGFIAGSASNTSSSTWAAAINAGGTPRLKANYGSGTDRGDVYNSFLYGNLLYWALKYSQENTNKSYIIP